jgi:hypothetical protein
MDDLLADELRTDMTDAIDGDRDRCDALLDAAQDHLQNKRPEQALAIWRQLVEEGGERSDDAFVAYVDYTVRHALNDEEQRRLEAEMAEGPISWPTRLRVAMLLERRGQLVSALRWYSSWTDQLTAVEVSKSPWAKLMVNGRRRVKWALGMELDAIDLLGDAGEVEGEDKYFDLLDLLRAPTIIRGRVQVWSRAEFAVALEHWPGRITVESVDAYYRAVEGVLREYDRPVTVFHLTFEHLTDCMDALDQCLAEAHRSEPPSALPQDDRPGVSWPPERNQACWCGSGKKYKKCCGMGLPSGARQAWGPAGLRSGAELAVSRV